MFLFLAYLSLIFLLFHNMFNQLSFCSLVFLSIEIEQCAKGFIILTYPAQPTELDHFNVL